MDTIALAIGYACMAISGVAAVVGAAWLAYEFVGRRIKLIHRFHSLHAVIRRVERRRQWREAKRARAGGGNTRHPNR